jgi:hypothetical protein
MQEVSQDGPSLFDAPPPASYEQAKEFVRWCCSFGTAFRNSPDVTNLRFWALKNDVQIKPGTENEILETARPLFLKRIDQFIRKAEAVKVDLPN